MENLNTPENAITEPNQDTSNNANVPPPISPPPPPTDVITSSAVTTVAQKKGSKFGLFVVIGIIIIVLIYSGVLYIYLQNQKIKKGGSTSKGSNQASSKSVSPTPAFSAEFVKIVNGNVVYQDPSSEAKVLVGKESFTETGITGFAKVSVSTDNSKICFESWPPSTTLAVYSANSDGSSAIQVSKSKKNCLFTSDGKKLLYIDSSPLNSESNIYLYDLDAKEEKNLTGTSQSANDKKKFEIVGLSADTNKVVCKYEPSKGGESKQCEIDLTTFELSYN